MVEVPAVLDVLGQATVEFRPTVAEKAERGAVLLGSGEVERRDQRADLVPTEFGEDVAALVADEAVAVEALATFGADAVGGYDRHDVADGVANHRATPHPAGVEVWIVGLRADRGGI